MIGLSCRLASTVFVTPVCLRAITASSEIFVLHSLVEMTIPSLWMCGRHAVFLGRVGGSYRMLIFLAVLASYIYRRRMIIMKRREAERLFPSHRGMPLSESEDRNATTTHTGYHRQSSTYKESQDKSVEADRRSSGSDQAVHGQTNGSVGSKNPVIPSSALPNSAMPWAYEQNRP